MRKTEKIRDLEKQISTLLAHHKASGDLLFEKQKKIQYLETQIQILKNLLEYKSYFTTHPSKYKQGDEVVGLYILEIKRKVKKHDGRTTQVDVELCSADGISKNIITYNVPTLDLTLFSYEYRVFDKNQKYEYWINEKEIDERVEILTTPEKKEKICKNCQHFFRFKFDENEKVSEKAPEYIHAESPIVTMCIFNSCAKNAKENDTCDKFAERFDISKKEQKTSK